jgi:hypothetical protein
LRNTNKISIFVIFLRVSAELRVFIKARHAVVAMGLAAREIAGGFF